MATATLEREPITSESYQPELDAIQEENASASPWEYSLEVLHRSIHLKQALMELGINPFKRESVLQYKQMMVCRSMPRLTRLANVVGAVVPFGVIITLSTFVLSALGTWLSPTLPGWLRVLGLGSAAGFGVVLLLCALFDRERVLVPVWAEIEWNRYLTASRVPEHVRETVERIKAKCPEAVFVVHELRLQRRGQWECGDPLLSVMTEGMRQYFIEVWNEPDFEKTCH